MFVAVGVREGVFVIVGVLDGMLVGKPIQVPVAERLTAANVEVE